MADFLGVATILGVGLGYSHYRVILTINYLIEIVDEPNTLNSRTPATDPKTTHPKLQIDTRRANESKTLPQNEPFPSPTPAGGSGVAVKSGKSAALKRSWKQLSPTEANVGDSGSTGRLAVDGSELTTSGRKKTYVTSPTTHHHHLHAFHTPVIATPTPPPDDELVSRISGIKAPHFNPNAVVSPESPRDYDIEPLEQLVEVAEPEETHTDTKKAVRETEEMETLPSGRRSSIGNLESINEEEEGEDEHKDAALLAELEGLSPRTSSRRRLSSLFEDVASTSIGESSVSQEEVIDELQDSITNSAASGSDASDEIFSLNRHHTTVNTEQMPSEAHVTKEFQKYKGRIA